MPWMKQGADRKQGWIIRPDNPRDPLPIPGSIFQRFHEPMVGIYITTYIFIGLFGLDGWGHKATLSGKTA